MIAQPQSALRVSPAVSDFPRDSVPRLAVAAPPQSAQRANQRPALAGLMQVFTCVHRNYFTRVMAQALRNAGQGTPTLIVQFLKGGCNQGPDKPMRFGQALDWVRCRLDHCINTAPQAEEDFAAVKELWAFTQAAIASGKYDAVVLDELSLAIAYGIISEDEVMDCLKSRPTHIEVTLTGQKMPQGFLQMADQVTELRNIFNTVLPEPEAPEKPVALNPAATSSTTPAVTGPANGTPASSTPANEVSEQTAPSVVESSPMDEARLEQAVPTLDTASLPETAVPDEAPPIQESQQTDPSAATLPEEEQASLMQLGLEIAGVSASTPHDVNLTLPPVDDLLVKLSEAQDQKIAELNAIEAKANRKSKQAGKRLRRRCQQQISLPGFD